MLANANTQQYLKIVEKAIGGKRDTREWGYLHRLYRISHISAIKLKSFATQNCMGYFAKRETI